MSVREYRSGLSASALSLACLLAGTSAGMATDVQVLDYSMPNGAGTANYGSYDYFDSTYSGSGNNTTDGITFNNAGYAQPNPAAYLSGGSGVLTDGVIATQNFSQVSTGSPGYSGTGQYVGWKYIDPTITFDLVPNRGVTGISIAVGLSPQTFNSYISNGQVVLGAGLVGAPGDVKLSINGAPTVTYSNANNVLASNDNGNSEILTILFPKTTATTFTLTLDRGPLLADGTFYNNYYNGQGHIGDPQFYLNAGQPGLEPWLLVSEVSFLGPDTGGVAGVPEASTWLMLVAGFLGLGLVGNRRKIHATSAVAA